MEAGLMTTRTSARLAQGRCCDGRVGCADQRPYRAPELLYGPHRYDAMALDLWSAGASLAELFTPFRLCELSTSTAISIAQLRGDSTLPSAMQYDSDESDSESSSEPRPSAPITRKTWKRMTLFNAEKGDLGLAWSIFQIRGTPTQKTWPVSRTI
jgi:hypothetical protein